MRKLVHIVSLQRTHVHVEVYVYYIGEIMVKVLSSLVILPFDIIEVFFVFFDGNVAYYA